MNYYGTDLNSAGHYLWELLGNDLYRNKTKIYDLPFNPEGLPYCETKGKQFIDGIVKYYHFCGFTICAIQGACSDKRPGSKSIFYVDGNFTPEEMKNKILEIPIGKRIIEKCPFEIKW